MSNYYYLIAGLPDLTLEDGKLSYTVVDFKREIYPILSDTDKKMIDLFYLKFDNANLLKLLKNKDAEIDIRGNYSVAKLMEHIDTIKEGATVNYSGSFPSYLTTFVTNYYSDMPMDDNLGLLENDLFSLYYAYGMESKSKFVSSWFEFNLTLNNIFVALVARKYKLDIARNIVGDTEVAEALRTSGARDFGLSSEVDYFDKLVKISEIDELLEREKKTDQLKWNWIEDETFFNYFSVERIFGYLLKIEMIERWLSLSKEKGREIFRELIDSLKDDVSIPSEFR